MAASAAGCASSSSGGAAAGSSASSSGSVDTPNGAAELQTAYETVISSTLPSIVQINTSTGLGSGIVLDSKGDIVTNAHVVGTAKTFSVSLSTGGAALNATLLASFPQGDLAVIKLDSPPANLRPATFADSSKLKVGQIAIAMGNPLGLSSSATQGIVSATGRTVSEPKTAEAPQATLTDMIQTSAAINPGNSGGALVDLSGSVIGIPTLAATDQELGGAAPGIGFAISSNTAKRIADQIVGSGKVTDSGLAALDVTVQTVTDASGQPVGVGVAAVSPNGAAANAGLKAGDVITALNGTPTPTADTLTQLLAGMSPGQKVTVKVTHQDGAEATVDVTLGTLAVS
ncbi:MAG TPA: trypsin-like peptidase domain-containing protein [Actinocrinis sp.]|nr:trypsin-like peptidase domain-containing protein [Actinocrinis sp.]